MDDTTRPTLQMLNPEMDEKFSLYINEISRDSWDHSLKAASLLAVSTTVFLITNLVFQRRSESLNFVVARAKRGRVFENEYEKANCRPTDPTRPPSKREGNVTRKCQKAGFKIVPLYFSSGPLLL